MTPTPDPTAAGRPALDERWRLFRDEAVRHAGNPARIATVFDETQDVPHTPLWAFTDDPADPCGYCVGWEEQPDDPLGEKARPYLPSGYVGRVYRSVHPECDRSVAAYVSEPS